jgi:3-phosphoshikimate 1-carboxyvinyltransferase
MALPDLIEIVPLDQPVRAEITVPGSKSITNRALILAALADGETVLRGALWSEDTQIMVECLQELGFMVNVEPDPAEPCNRTITVYGNGGAVPPGSTEAQPMELFVGNAGTAARFLAAFVCLGKGVYRLSGVARMHERPQAALFQALRELGYRVEAEFDNEKLPVRIYGGDAASERKRGIESVIPKYQGFLTSAAGGGLRSCKVSIEQSSQFASALLLSAKCGGWKIEVAGENAKESPYVAMTSKLIEAFPKNGGFFQIEPDVSSGSYFLAAKEFAPPSEFLEYSEQFGIEVETSISSSVKVNHWPKSGWQIDERFLEFLTLGPLLHDFPNLIEKSKLLIEKSKLEKSFDKKSFRDLLNSSKGEISRQSDLGDSIMLAIAIAPLSMVFPTGFIKFTDLGRLRVQECERVVALRTELTKCGAKVIEEGDTLTVYPSKPEELHGAEIETYHDHRMAMCFAILGLKVPGIKIKNPACVKKTFPNFFQKLAAPPPHGLGATILDAKSGRKLELNELFAD